MRDGTVLRADVWLPAGAGPWPVLLQRTPYRKEDVFGTQYIAALEFRAALRRGYAVVVQDTRGRYASDGNFDPFHHEQDDGHDTIAWLRKQPFCNGSVAMFGASYVGATQVLALLGSPEGLVATAPNLTTARHGETWLYRGGAIELGFLLLWIIEALGPVDLERRIGDMPPEYAERARALLSRFFADPTSAFRRLPVIDEDLALIAPYVEEWFDNARAEAAADDHSRLDEIARSKAACLVIGGWNDLFIDGSIELFETVRSRWSTRAEVPDRLVIGPWSHGNPTDWQGDGWHGYGALAVPLFEEQLAFFDAAFAGKPPGSPMVRYFRTGSNSWHAAPDWPLPGTQKTELFLGEGGGLAETVQSEAWHQSYGSNPRDPVPTVGGASFLPGLLLGRNSGPKDQAAVESRDDVLTFTSSPLEEPLEVTGLVEAALWIHSSAPTCDWAVRLCEVGFGGKSVGLLDGIVRWRRSEPEGTGGPEEAKVRLGHVGHLFAKGSRIRIQVASSNFPRYDRNPQSGTPSSRANESDFQVAQQTVFGGVEHPSRIVLPVVPEAFPSAPVFNALGEDNSIT